MFYLLFPSLLFLLLPITARHRSSWDLLEYGVRAPVFYGNLPEQTGENGFPRIPTGILFVLKEICENFPPRHASATGCPSHSRSPRPSKRAEENARQQSDTSLRIAVSCGVQPQIRPCHRTTEHDMRPPRGAKSNGATQCWGSGHKQTVVVCSDGIDPI